MLLAFIIFSLEFHSRSYLATLPVALLTPSIEVKLKDVPVCSPTGLSSLRGFWVLYQLSHLGSPLKSHLTYKDNQVLFGEGKNEWMNRKDTLFITICSSNHALDLGVDVGECFLSLLTPKLTLMIFFRCPKIMF